jgi:SAM-dependent methyltransferase
LLSSATGEGLLLKEGNLGETLSALRTLTALLRPQPEPVRKAFRALLDELRLARAAASAAPQFAALRSTKGLRIHLGCGNDIREGWVNVDFGPAAPPTAIKRGPDTSFIAYDLRSGTLPLDDGSCELIYSSHFFEHLEYDDGVRLMRDCHRVLQPGGLFRAALPNFEGLFRAYVAADESYFDLYSIYDVYPDRPPETVSLADHVNLGVYEYGHKCIYDREKVMRLLRHLGFASVEITDYREGIDPGAEIRRRYSFYVDALK